MIHPLDLARMRRAAQIREDALYFAKTVLALWGIGGMLMVGLELFL